jgi:hypothetical protein
MPASPIATVATKRSTASGLHRRDGKLPVGKSSSGQVTSTISPTKVQLSSQAAHCSSGLLLEGGASTQAVAKSQQAVPVPPPRNASPSRFPASCATISAPSAAHAAAANPSPTSATSSCGSSPRLLSKASTTSLAATSARAAIAL